MILDVPPTWFPPDISPGAMGDRLAEAVAPAALPAAAVEAARSNDRDNPTVLVVEDDEATRLAMKSWLAAEEFSVLAAATGHQAAEYLERSRVPIAVVVLDVGLPDMDGVSLCARIRHLDPRMPVLVCSGAASPDEVARLVALGASRYFRKPVNPDELLSAVEAALP